MKTIYVCSDTITGIFSSIYDAWRSRKEENNCGIALRGMVEQELFCEYTEVDETNHKAEAVEALIKNHLGRLVYWDIYHAALSRDPKKGDAILGTMLTARTLARPEKIMEHLSHPKVEKVFELSRNVGGEAHAFKGYLRFRELANGVMFAEIEPENQILTCLAPHFADRLPRENWMIYDKAHGMFVVHEAGKKWALIWGEQLNIEGIMNVSEKEREFTRLWKGFCQTISIEARESRKRQIQNLPLKYQRNMVEFTN